MKRALALLLFAGCAGPATVGVASNGTITLDGRAGALAAVGAHVAGEERPEFEIHPDARWSDVRPVLKACLDAGTKRVRLTGIRLELHEGEPSTEVLVFGVEIKPGPRYKFGTEESNDLERIAVALRKQFSFSRWRYAHPIQGVVRADAATHFETVREVVLAMRAAGLEWVSLRVGQTCDH